MPLAQENEVGGGSNRLIFKEAPFMYSLRKDTFGVRMAFEGFIKPEVMAEWLVDSEHLIKKIGNRFHVMVDMREMMPFGKEAQATIETGQKLYKTNGMDRSVVILSSATLTMQFMRIAKETGIYEWERYIDASKNAAWERTAIEWLEKGVDPDDQNR